MHLPREPGGLLIRSSARVNAGSVAAAGAVLVAITLVGCGGGGGAAPSPRGASSCEREAERGARRFLDAISQGDARRADGLVSEHGFVWLVLGVRPERGQVRGRLRVNQVVRDRDRVLSYLLARTAAGDAFRVDAINIVSRVGDRVGVEVLMRRRADDLASGRWLPMRAKGEWLCHERALSGLAGHATIPA